MCGIFCSVSSRESMQPSETVKQHLQSRGPDASNQICICLETTTRCHLVLHSTVLSLRGASTTQQPFQRAQSPSSLCWNGEAWTIAGERPAGNDTSAIFHLLDSAPLRTRDTPAETQAQYISRALSTVAGPYAFVFFDHSSARLFFGRDFLGRRSLLCNVTAAGDVLLSSVADGSADGSWTELEADGIYCLELSDAALQPHATHQDLHRLGSFKRTKVPYTFIDGTNNDSTSVLPQLSLKRSIPTSVPEIHHSASSVRVLEEHLHKSLSLRVKDIPEIPQRARDLFGLARAKLAVLFSGGLDCTTLARICHDILDPTEPIDLLNVAFQNPRVHKTAGERSFELCPDRVTGRASYVELCKTCPGREWRFLSINVPYNEFLQHRQKIVTLMHPHNTEMDLSIAAALYFAARGEGMVASQKLVQDCAYTTSARVLLSGLGADELFAGYTRHATAFNRAGYEGLLDELELEIARLGKRNLGRDDRVISHWGREARFPFLDEYLLQWALGIPVTEKCGFAPGVQQSLDGDARDSMKIEPGKKVLRCLAWRLGMEDVAKEKKRAIQFGARTAKMETGKTKGTTLLP